MKKQWQGFQQAPSAITEWDTGVDPSLLMYIGINSVKYPEEFVSNYKFTSIYNGSSVARRMTDCSRSIICKNTHANILQLGYQFPENKRNDILIWEVKSGNLGYWHAFLHWTSPLWAALLNAIILFTIVLVSFHLSVFS